MLGGPHGGLGRCSSCYRYTVIDRRRQERKSKKVRDDREDGSEDSASDEEESSGEQSPSTSMGTASYSGDDSLLKILSNAASSSAPYAGGASATVATSTGFDFSHSVPSQMPTLEFDGFDNILTPNSLSTSSWQDAAKTFERQWPSSVSPLEQIPIDSIDWNKEHWETPNRAPTLRTVVLTLDNVPQNTLSQVLELLLKSETKVGMETHR